MSGTLFLCFDRFTYLGKEFRKNPEVEYIRASVVRASLRSAFFGSKPPVHRKKTSNTQYAEFIIINSTKMEAWGSSKPKTDCFCVRHCVERLKEYCTARDILIFHEKSAPQNEKRLPKSKIPNLEKLQRNILSCLFAAVVIDGENCGPGAAIHLNIVFQFLEGLVSLVLESFEGIPVNLDVFPHNFGGLHHGLVQALRWLISERLVYDDHDLLR